MTASPVSARAGARRAPGVRTLLLAAATVLLLFVTISVASLFRLMPAAKRLGVRGRDLATVSHVMQALDSSVSVMADELTSAAHERRRAGRLPEATSEDLRLRLRYLADSTLIAQGRLFGSLPDSARIALAHAMVAERNAVSDLLDAEIRLTLGDADGALEHVTRAGRQRATARRHLDALAEAIALDLDERETGYVRASDRALRFTIWWAVAGFLLLGLAAVVAYTRLYAPLGSLERGLRELATGNFRHRQRVRWDDELGRLQEHMNYVAQTLGARATTEAQTARNLSDRLGRVLDEGSSEIYVFDAATWRYVVTNRAARRGLGYTESQLTALTPLDVLPEYTRDRFAAVLDTVRSGIQPRAFLATTQRRANGQTYPVELTLRYSETEHPPVFHAVVQDVSERTRLEAERDLVFLRSADLMAIGSVATGRLQRVNPAMVAALGLPAGDIAGRAITDFVHPDDQALVRRQLDQLAGNVPVRGAAVRLRADGGEYRWVSWNIEPPRDGTFYAIGRDITDRRRAESRQAELQAAVARSAREWRLTFDALEDPVVIVSHMRQIVRLNEAARRLAGQPHADVLGRGLDVLEPASLWSRAASLVEEVHKNGGPGSCQMRCGRDGRTWDLQVHPVSGMAAGQPAAIIVAHDVTPVVRLQDSARRNEAMAAMGALVAGVAHEVRNPLFSMTATLDAFEARLGPEPPAGRSVRVLRAQLDRLQQLMRDLLEYGKPPQLSLTSVVFEGVARLASDECALVARERRVAITMEIPDGLPSVRADRARLTQVYVNLLLNAIHHSPEGTAVVIRAREVRQDGAAWIETTVEDSGRGFQVEDLPRVFEPFFSRRSGGTGLGLALVHRIVEQHGGAVTAANRPHGGAVVTVRLPILPPESGEAGHQPGVGAP